MLKGRRYSKQEEKGMTEDEMAGWHLVKISIKT